MWSVYVSTFFFFSCLVRSNSILRGIEVPQYSFAGGNAKLGCRYDLRTTRLYSLKWYHNTTEFYRYVPTERAEPFHRHPTNAFKISELWRREGGVRVLLKDLNVDATGQYKCEVIAEHPTFRTEAGSATMIVLAEPLRPPIVSGGREIYTTGDKIEVSCTAPRPPIPGHPLTLDWIINGKNVDSEYVRRYMKKGGPGIDLLLPANYVVSKGGTVKSECRVTLGSHQLATYKILRVPVRQVSYHRSKAGCEVYISTKLLIITSTLLYTSL